MNNKTVGVLWLIIMLLLVVVGSVAGIEWMIEAAIAGAVGFGVGRIWSVP